MPVVFVGYKGLDGAAALVTAANYPRGSVLNNRKSDFKIVLTPRIVGENKEIRNTALVTVCC